MNTILNDLPWFVRFFFREKKEEAPKIPGYVIQPTSVPSTTASANKSFIDKMKSSKRRMVVFYGSQTGTAEEFAGRLAKEGARYGLKGIVADPEEIDLEDLSKIKDLEDDLDGPTLAVFMMATYGEGDPTDNAQELFEWLKNGGDDLQGLNFAVFGLGNKTYEHYNEMGIFLDKKLGEMGCKRIHKLGLGDDDANIEDDFITWKEEFWQSVCSTFKLEALGDDFSMRQYEMKVTCCLYLHTCVSLFMTICFRSWKKVIITRIRCTPENQLECAPSSRNDPPLMLRTRIWLPSPSIATSTPATLIAIACTSSSTSSKSSELTQPLNLM